MNRRTDGRTAACASKPLSNVQKASLVGLAREAFGVLADCGALGEAAEFDRWRQEQVLQVCEKPGVSACGNGDFLPLKAHFLRMAGRSEAAVACEERAEHEPRLWALAVLEKEIGKAGPLFPQGRAYVEGYLRRCETDIDGATANQIWKGVYLLKRKVGLLKKAHSEVGGPI